MKPETVKLVESVLKNTTEYKLKQFKYEEFNNEITVTSLNEGKIYPAFLHPFIVGLINSINHTLCSLEYCKKNECVVFRIK